MTSTLSKKLKRLIARQKRKAFERFDNNENLLFFILDFSLLIGQGVETYGWSRKRYCPLFVGTSQKSE